MSTNRINTALVGEGRQLSDLLANLVTRSPLLRLKIVAIVDLDPQPNGFDKDLLQGSGVQDISTSIDDILTREDLDLVQPHCIIMHPLPRRYEIEVEVDNDARAVFWRQERNGMWMRAAVLIRIFGMESRVRNFDLEAVGEGIG